MALVDLSKLTPEQRERFQAEIRKATLEATTRWFDLLRSRAIPHPH